MIRRRRYRLYYSTLLCIASKCNWRNMQTRGWSFHFYVALYYSSLRASTNRQTFKDKGFIVSGAEVQGACASASPPLFFFSEIFEWDQTVIRSESETRTSTQSRAHACVHALAHTTPASLAGSGLQGGVGSGNGATPKEASRNGPVL